MTRRSLDITPSVRRLPTLAAVLLICGLAAPSAQERRPAAPVERWVSTWATSLQLAPSTFGRGGRGGPARGAPPGPSSPGAAAPTPTGSGTEAPFRRVAPQPANVPPTLSDQTVRMVIRASLGGSSVRVSLSNMSGAEPLEIGAAHLAVARGGGAIDPATDRALRFGGQPSILVPPGALVMSDPVSLAVAPLEHLAVSVYLPRDTGPPTTHNVALHTGYIAAGDVTGSSTLTPSETTAAYLWLSSVEVLAPADAGAVVALGDSITDGFATSHDADRAWPTLLAARLAGQRGGRPIAVLNQGISGNQVLRDGAGLSMLARFDRDVLARPGVRWLILLGGINDINLRGRTEGPGALTSEELIAGYRQIVARSHAHGIRVIGATLTPEEGVPTASPRGEEIRQAVNAWIRTSGHFDAVVDFDAALRDPHHESRLRAEFDPGDHIHPNDAGNEAMAAAFDLGIFRR